MVSFDNKMERKKSQVKLKLRSKEKSYRKSKKVISDEMYVEDKVEIDQSNNYGKGNPGWADAMQKILQTKKPKRKRAIVLCKAKKLCDVKKGGNEESTSLKVEDVKEKVKVPEVEKIVKRKQKTKSNLGIRVKPLITDRERERCLQKIATKGVVQLFNAVKQQQGEISKRLSEAGALERKREKVLKSIDKCAFLDILMGGSKSIQPNNNPSQEINGKNSQKDQETWSVLREDFVMGTKLKDWDCKNNDEDSLTSEDMDSDD